MKIIKKKLVVFLFIITLQVCFNSVSAEEELYTVSGFVTGCSSKNSIHVILYNEASFKDMTAIEEIIYEPTGSEECKVPFTLNTPKGSYTIAAFEDENNNKKLDFFFFIPKEPSGFFRKFSGMSAPKFEKLKFDVDSDFVGADVDLQ
tara:strand:- start:79 stop:519 length:441 start_codon:yes stop_codon:yes gene_type:complete